VGTITATTIEIPDAEITVTKVWSPTKVQGRITSTIDFVVAPIDSITMGNIKIDGIWANAQPLAIDYVSSGAAPYDSMAFDNVNYDENGIPLVGNDVIDTMIRSNFTEDSLGLRPEDINVDGGEYIDTFSSHAPEELVPGITFDTLDMKIYTKINSGADVLGYRVFTNMLRETTFLRIADDYSTKLTSALELNDFEIEVDDATKLPTPSPSNGIPGVIFVNGERITYYRNYSSEVIPWVEDTSYRPNTVLSYSGNSYISTSELTPEFDLGDATQHAGNVRLLPSVNILGQIRRGTQGTPIMVVQPAGATVVDGSIEQIIPDTTFGNIEIATETTLQTTTAPAYEVRLSSAVQTNVGDVITQATSSVSATVVGIDRNSDVVLLTYNNAARFDFASVVILLSGNVSVSAGDYLTQSTTGANLRILSETVGSNIIAVYTTLDSLTVNDNVAINGVDAEVYPRTVGVSTNLLSNIAINGNYTSNALAFNDAVYPLVDALAGKVDENGQVTVGANTTLTTSTVWQNAGAPGAIDGTGFEGAVTEQILFLKQATATNTVVASIQDLLTTEDTVNILITEDGQQILEE
jgi:hypothetical protein